MVIDTLSYVATKIAVNPDTIDFGRVRLNTSKQMLSVLTNNATSPINIKEIRLATGKDYSIVWGATPPEFTLAPGDTHHIWIEYKPTVESVKPSILDRDSLLVSTECPPFSWPIQGRGVIPRIKVEDWDAGTIVAGNRVCKSSQTGTGLLIENPGSDTLVITDIAGVIAPFELSNPYKPTLPIRIPEGGSVYLQDICYAPAETGDYSIDVLFKNNAIESDSVSNWRGKAVKPGPYITNYDWKEQRVLFDSTYYISLKNGGTSSIKVNGVGLGVDNTQQQDFTIIRTEPDVINNVVTLMPDNSTSGTTEIKIWVKFTPQSEFAKTNTVIPKFNDNNVEPGSVVGKLDGYGILPKIKVTGYEFNPPILIGATHPATGYVTIESTSETADLFIRNIAWNQNTAPRGFHQ
jgi:archaellum component FlaG (FlaF/FlaG flagellin family)